jgi:hypothetical protein
MSLYEPTMLLNKRTYGVILLERVNAWLNGSFLANRDSIEVHNKFLISHQMDMVVNL